MWISVRRLWLGAAILWSTMLCIASGVVVDTEVDSETDFLPVVLAHEEEQSDRGGSLHESGVFEGALHYVDEETEASYSQDDLSCTELRSKRYISDGFCTSTRPITEMVCTGECVPRSLLNEGADIVKVWGRTKTKEWRCVNDVVKLRRVHLVCNNGETRTYRIRTVKSCKCKRYDKRHNDSDLENTNENANEERPSREDRRRDRRKQKRQNRERSNRRNDREKRLASFPEDN
ncbi:sclerostin domain-containing protein 1-like [Acanthaster planci]|uniref:Sclerostin domain-containing protein 1-like n=1 Tax=Acanthaster planci TaxID=133434 RepID=A0A8B7ZF35_ACAPL|nr:sclerostin domain-containing protein 1-like [Acanthaster planci]XP_022104274.1 sclerostin domain-containing protein 1-like [Acanthaster planci]